MKIVIRNGEHVSDGRPASDLPLAAGLTRDVLFHRGVGAGLVPRASAELGQGLRPVPAASAPASGALLHPLPPGLSERSGIRVDLHRLVT